MRKSIISIILILAFFISRAQETKTISLKGFAEEIHLESLFDTLQLQDEILLVHAVVADTKAIYVLNDKGKPVIRAYGLEKGNYLGGVGSIGGGPGEFLMINRGSFGLRKGQLLVHGRKYIRLYNLSVLENRIDFSLAREGRIPGDALTINNGFMLDENHFAGSIDFTSHEFASFSFGDKPLTKEDLLNTSKHTFGNYPNLHPEIPVTAYHHLYNSNGSASPDGKYFAVVYQNFPLIGLYDLNSKTKSYLQIEGVRKEQKTKIQADDRGMSIRDSFDLFKYGGALKMSNDLMLVDFQEYQMVNNGSEWIHQNLSERFPSN